jgi:hypothetical protein
MEPNQEQLDFTTDNIEQVDGETSSTIVVTENETKLEDTIVLFKCIVDFIHCLREMFGKQQHSLELYDLLMEKTGIVHQDPIKKHVKLFRDFLKINEDAILENNEEKMTQWKIEYSEKVFIDLKAIFLICVESDKQTIWQHLLTLMAVLIPTSNAKNVLKDKKLNKNKEGDFLTNLINKVEKHVEPSSASDPAQMMSGILSSGLFSELMEDMNRGMSDGDLDITKMMGSLQGMIGNMSNMFENMDHKS